MLMQAVQWGSGVAVYSLLNGSLSWACALPNNLLAADATSARLAISTLGGRLAFFDAHGPADEGVGLLRGLQSQGAQFMDAAKLRGHVRRSAVCSLAWAAQL